jgi:peptidoglycan/xylan/chitin deacetylase (PgdA/CDA1 family)
MRQRGARRSEPGSGMGLAASRGPGSGSQQRRATGDDRHSPDQTRVEEMGNPEAPVGRTVGDRLVVQRRLDTPQVALTFDDGPDAATPRMLELLKQHGVKATFCVIGTSVQAHPEMVRQIVADGHSLCNHTFRHDLHLGTRGAAAIRADLQQTSDAIHAAAPGAPIRYFRHPGGNFTPASASVAKDLGMISLGWDVDPNDWNLSKFPQSAARAEHVVSLVSDRARPGSIVLSHDGGGDRSATIAAYERLLPWL